MATPTDITSTAQFDNLMNSNTCLVVDFKAEWCGPCKMIAPVFAQLAAQETKRGKMAFAKVDVDSQRDIAQRYSVSAMPTFLIIKGGSVSETVRGANPQALRAAVLRAAADAARGGAKAGAAFEQQGRTLGSGGAPARPAFQASNVAQSLRSGHSLIDTIVRFVALYITTLFSLNAETAARGSQFSVARN